MNGKAATIFTAWRKLAEETHAVPILAIVDTPQGRGWLSWHQTPEEVLAVLEEAVPALRAALEREGQEQQEARRES